MQGNKSVLTQLNGGKSREFNKYIDSLYIFQRTDYEPATPDRAAPICSTKAELLRQCCCPRDQFFLDMIRLRYYGVSTPTTVEKRRVRLSDYRTNKIFRSPAISLARPSSTYLVCSQKKSLKKPKLSNGLGNLPC